MNDNDLRALAAKLLKHYVADQNPVAEALVAQIPLNRLPAKVIPLITAEQRALLDMLGGEWADVHEGKNVALIAQGCGGCGSCGGGDGGGSDGGGEGGGSGGDAGAGAGADGAGQGADAGADAGQGSSDAGAGFGGLSGADAAGWGGFSASDVGAAQADAQSTADAQDASMQANASISTADPSTMSQAMQDALAASQNQDQNAPDPGISVATYGSLADQNAQANATLDSVNAGLDANAAGQGTGDSGNSWASLFGISPAAAATFDPANSSIAAIQDAARAAAAQGQYNEFVSNPNYSAAIDPQLNAQLSATNNAALEAQGQQSIYASQPGQAITGSPTGGATLSGLSSAASVGAPAASNPYGSLSMSPEQAQQAELNGQLAAIGSNAATAAGFTGAPTASNPYGNISMSPEQAQQAELNGQLAAIGSNPATATGFTGPGFGPSSPVAAASSLAPESPTTSLTIGPSSQPSTQAPSYTGIAAIDDRINNALTNPGTTALNIAVGAVPGLGLANSLSGLVGGPTVGGAITGLLSGTNAGAAPGTTPTSLDSGGGGNVSDGSLIPPITPAGLSTTPGNTSAPGSTSSPSTSTGAPSATPSAIRQYLGLSGDPTQYGFGAEQQFYGPAAAKGGYFDAEQYFADGGMVQPLSAPTTPLVSTQPTMAFTDGAGPVGSIAQPPGLSPNQSVGFDATTASPMAPSVAAAAPSVQPGLATLAMPSTNANPVPSQIAQNPNVGYALGNSPLSNLTGS